MRTWIAGVLLLAACGGADDSAGHDAARPDAAVAPDAMACGSDDLAGPIAWDPELDPWPMQGHDPRRTGRSEHVGPTTYTAASPANWTYVAIGGSSIDMQATITGDGVYVGTWGVVRREPGATHDHWTKFDGKYYGLEIDDGAELFPPFDPRPDPYCYQLAGRAPLPRDATGCNSEPGAILSYNNGTIEGSALVDPVNRRQYVGRGDNFLYAIDTTCGAVAWEFQTFNPLVSGDPDGGGEVVGGAVMDPAGTIYFGTFSAGDAPQYETDAFYAVDRTGALVWRYPPDTATLDNGFLAAPALSPDGQRLYAATWGPGGGNPAGRLLAFDLTTGTLAWEMVLTNPANGQPGWARHLSVGADGIIYVGGTEAGFGYVPMVAAVHDDGASGSYVWTPAWIAPQGYPTSNAQWVQGIALWEESGHAVRLYAATGHLRELNGTGGVLLALDAATGATLATFDPAALATPGIGGMTAPTLDADENVFVGIRGKHDAGHTPEDPASQWRDGTMYAVSRTGATFATLWSMDVAGLLDWPHPAIGADGAVYFGSTDRWPPFGLATPFGPDEVAQPHYDPRFYRVKN